MKYRNGLVKKAAALLMSAVLVGANAAPVRAAETTDLNLTKTGAIKLTLMDTDGVTVTGGAVTIYEVAKLTLDDGDMAYVFTDDFADCTVTLDVTDTTLAASLVSYMDGLLITGMEKEVSTNGMVCFTDLELGLYLVAQTTESAEYETISPFVVTLPVEEDSVWVYTVNASPKVGAVTLTLEEPEPETPAEEVYEEPETPVLPQTGISETALPQTGQLNWPLPILGIGGLLLLTVGFYLKNEERKSGYYAL
ncbi:MAG: LPXTG cell wall anchor domain-containing protein [Lachnospiraceae bacterium]|nr:LPXTG cell wall anchor domain-containing protein [Lachnospiraceae bacterium]